ncbi:MAG: ABC transporter [Gammaproteobacteria bacterium RIFCSPLOWO2_02_FULL_56_15]|nr:MAG: ABC transporter [Gammaproteobacteria bacterium RIFCSPLOWO2_02_FULL_56_15]
MAEPGGRFAGSEDRPRASSVKQVRQILPFMRPYLAHLGVTLCFLILAALLALSIPVAVRQVIDHGFSTAEPAAINSYFRYLLILALGFALFSALRYYFVMWLGERVVADIRARVYRQVIDMSPAFFESTPVGEVLSRLTTDTTLVQSVVGAGISIALRSTFTLCGGLIMLFVTSSRLAVLILVLFPVVVLPILLYGRKIRKLSRASQDRIADASSLAGETLNAVQVVQAFTLENFLGRRFSDSVERAFHTARARLRASALLSGIIVFTSFGAIIVVLWTGAHAVIEGSVSAGTLGQFILYAVMVAGSTTALGEVWSDVQRAAGAMERLMELLNTRPQITIPAEPVPLPEDGQGHIRFEAVRFSYPSRPGQHALNEFSLEVRPGETVALVGPSGAGKSTVFQLLLRFYDPQAGRILIQGVDIKQADPREVRGRIGIVPQQTALFADSALENIRYGLPEADEAAIRAAAKAAMAHEFIEKLPEGYHSFLGEKGLRLSGGQQQRIAIARAVLKNPPILLLDEATSSLDAESEKLVQEALEHLMQERTTLVIAHRLATVKKADRIVVLDEGRIIDSGSHEELYRRGGLYARLADLQFGERDGSVEVEELLHQSLI